MPNLCRSLDFSGKHKQPSPEEAFSFQTKVPAILVQVQLWFLPFHFKTFRPVWPLAAAVIAKCSELIPGTSGVLGFCLILLVTFNYHHFCPFCCSYPVISFFYFFNRWPSLLPNCLFWKSFYPAFITRISQNIIFFVYFNTQPVDIYQLSQWKMQRNIEMADVWAEPKCRQNIRNNMVRLILSDNKTCSCTWGEQDMKPCVDAIKQTC